MRFLVLEDYREMALCFLFSVPAASIGANNAQTQRTPIAIDPMTRIWPSSESPIARDYSRREGQPSPRRTNLPNH